MRLYRYLSAATNRDARVAVATAGGEPQDLMAAWRAAGHTTAPPYLSSVLSLIEGGPGVWNRIAEVVGASSPDVASVDTSSEGFRWLSPLDKAASLKDFLAFEDHVKRGAERRGTEVPAYWYEAPVYYKGNHRTLLGPDEECPWPRYTEYLDFELELAMIVGRRGGDLTPEVAGDYIFGFTVFNDFSARDIQAREMTAWLGPAKGKDFANGFGPCIVTVDELGTEPDLFMTCRIDGQEWGNGRSSAMHWSWRDMLVHVSQGEGVHPGDVFGSGTPGGCCGLDLGRRLAPGSVVELEIENIGVLRNTIGQKEEAA